MRKKIDTASPILMELTVHLVGAHSALGTRQGTEDGMVKKVPRIPAQVDLVGKMDINQIITQINIQDR